MGFFSKYNLSGDPERIWALVSQENKTETFIVGEGTLKQAKCSDIWSNNIESSVV